MNSRKIGKIVAVKSNGIIGEIYSNIRNYINTLDETLFVGEIGSFVSIYNFDKIIIGEIVAIDAKTDINEKNYNKPLETKKIILNLVGELQEEKSDINSKSKEYKFTFGVSRMPLIFSDIYISSKEEINGIFKVTHVNEKSYIQIGKSVVNDNYDVKANINSLFGSHFAVLGNTGAGKSNTLAYIIQKIFSFKDIENNATFIFIDSNGEYADAWKKLSENNVKVIQYKVPDDLIKNNTNLQNNKCEDDTNTSSNGQENLENSDSQNSAENTHRNDIHTNTSLNEQENSDNSNSQNSSENRNKNDINIDNNTQENENNVVNNDNNVETKDLEIPVWALSADDWAVLLQATEKTQLPVLYRAIEFAKIFYSTGDIIFKSQEENLSTSTFKINCLKYKDENEMEQTTQTTDTEEQTTQTTGTEEQTTQTTDIEEQTTQTTGTEVQTTQTTGTEEQTTQTTENITTREKIHNYIIAKIITETLMSTDNPMAKSEKIINLLNKYCTKQIFGHKQIDDNKIRIDNRHEKDATLYNLFSIYYGNLVLYKDESKITKLFEYLENFTDTNLLHNYIIQDETIKYSIEQFKEMLELAIMYEGSLNSSRIYEYTSTLLIRLDAFINSNQSKVFTRTKCNTTNAYIKKFITDKNIINIDLSNLDDLSAEIIVKVISKILLEYLKSLEPRASKPINLIVEEAHRYIRNENQYGALNYNIFDRIAKEGRKYGFLMGISSQRPSDLSKTVLSQCSNYIIHRIQNPEDLHYIGKMVPFINENMLSQITYIQTGLALIFGSAINVPVITYIPKAEPTTNSHNADIMKCWFGNEE